jgi:hypothetical protein
MHNSLTFTLKTCFCNLGECKCFNSGKLCDCYTTMYNIDKLVENMSAIISKLMGVCVLVKLKRKDNCVRKIKMSYNINDGDNISDIIKSFKKIRRFSTVVDSNKYEVFIKLPRNYGVNVTNNVMCINLNVNVHVNANIKH